MIRLGVAVAGLALGVLFILWLAAPQIFRLWHEGFPGPTWPTPGRFADVAGVERPHPALGRAPHGLSDQGLVLFEQSGGTAFLMAREGELVREAYGPDANRETRLNSYSLVKSLVGVLVLRAVADGRIEGLETRLPVLIGPAAPDITIAETLRMTSGLRLRGEPPKPAERGKPLDDASFSPFSPVARMHAFGIDAIMQDLIVDPEMRGVFHYQSANTALLGLVLKQVYDRPLPDLLSEYIWIPAGTAPAHWRENPTTGRVSAYCCLYARPIDWLRVGRFLLDNGTHDAPLLPEPMWRDWLDPQLDPDVRRQGVYGWHLRHDVLDRPAAPVSGSFAYMMGHGGQVVYLLPEQNTVIVRFGDTPQLLHSTVYSAFAP